MRDYPIPFNEEDRVKALRSVPGLTPDSEPLFDTICDMTRRLLDCPIAHISVVDGDVQWYKSVVGMDLGPMPKEQSFCTHAIMADDVLVVPDLSKEARFARHPMVIEGGPGARFYAGVPLVLSSGFRFGSLCALDVQPHDRPSEHQLDLLRDLGRMTVAALERRPPEAPAPSDDSGPSAFVTLIGHELRTPLSVILGGIGIIEAKSEEVLSKRLAGSALKSARHLSELIEAIIRYSNARTGEVKLNESVVDLDAIVEEVVAMHRPMADDAGKSLVAEGPGIGRPVFMDAQHAKLALTALTLNALFHGGSRIVVAARLDAEGNVEIGLEDDGTIDAAVELAQLYEPFVVGGNLDHRGTAGGLGLGLPLTRKLVELHAGDFEVETRPGRTTAVIRLPRWRVRGG